MPEPGVQVFDLGSADNQNLVPDGIGKRIIHSGTPGAMLHVGYWCFLPGEKIALHWHPYEEFIYVLSGYGQQGDRKGNVHPIRPGTCVHCPGGEAFAHSTANTGDVPLEVLFVYPTAKEPVLHFLE